MSVPDRLVWGQRPDEEQRERFYRMIAKTLTEAKPPMPNAYRSALFTALKANVDEWDWWQARWYPDWDEKSPNESASP